MPNDHDILDRIDQEILDGMLWAAFWTGYFHRLIWMIAFTESIRRL